jgi:tRNA dimethylallyltransferase
LKLQRYPAFVLVGGSGLYIHSLLYGIDTMPPIPAAIRAQIREELRQGAMAPLAEEVRIADPVFASSADLQNPRRIQRALEVIRTTGRPYSAYRTSTTKEKYQSLWLVPEWQRDALYARIHQRTEAMVAQGFEAEARALWSYKHLQALQTVGYREWFAYFDGQSTREAAIEQIKMQTRRYAKRQITWFRNQAPTFFPLKNASISEALTLAEAFLK